MSYSAENQLLSVTTSSVTADYSYGPANRRVRKDVDGVVTDFVMAGEMVIAEYDGSGNLLRRYIPGPGVDQRIVMVDCGTSAACVPWTTGTQTDYYHADRQGNVLAVTRRGSDTMVQRYFYTPFGVEMVGDPTGNPFRYTGRYYDQETGLYYYRARYYDADLGRFLSVDPIGYADQWNLYAYVGNNPLNATDPSGMCSTGTRIKAHSAIGCHIAYGAPSRRADPEGENRHTVQTHYQDGSGNNVYYDPENYNVGADDSHGEIVQDSANGGYRGTIQQRIQASIACGCAVDVSFTTKANTKPATNPQRGSVFGQHAIDWTGTLQADPGNSTYEIWATGSIDPDRYDFNLGADRGLVAEVAVWGSYFVPTRIVNIWGVPVPRPYAAGTSFDLISNRSLEGTFWGTYQ